MEPQHYDLIILGSGCAGLTAAIYAGRAQLRTLILEDGLPGGQASTTGTIENYPGILSISGPQLMEQMRKQALSFGVAIQACTVHSAALNGPVKQIITSIGAFQSDAVILATGATPKKLGFEGEDQFRGRGVGYCAVCDGSLFRGKEVFVIGGGNSAAEEALYLTRFAKKVAMLVRKDSLQCERVLARQVCSNPRIEIRFHTELIRAFGEQVLTGAVLKDNKTGKTYVYTAPEEDGAFGVFVFVGHQPASGVFTGQVEMDKAGYILTDERMETNLPGVFAAGDVRAKELRQLVTAASDGAIAAVRAGEYVLAKKEKTALTD